MERLCCVFALFFAVAFVAVAEFKLEDDGKAVTVMDGDKPVLVYHYTRVDPPEGVDKKRCDKERYWRMDYIHPLYGLDGDVLTQDFPDDHYHHRGVFWAWPKCKVGDRPMDVWAIDKARQVFDEWLAREAGPDSARVGVQNVWKFDDDPAPKVREQVYFTVHPADDKGRAIDFDLKFENVSNEVVSFLGADNKGYGGFCFRPDKARKPMMFTTIKGAQPQDKDALEFDTPWADVSMRIEPSKEDASKDDGPVSGVAIFQNPKNPGYPYKGWIFRHYGFLGACWPHLETYELKPGEYFQLRYRLYVHRGTAEQGSVAEQFQEYVKTAE